MAVSRIVKSKVERVVLNALANKRGSAASYLRRRRFNRHHLLEP